ncbi:TRL domain-containing protein [Helicobacter suis]|nr:TRL domain-containing protein [Helicobacter suis]
MFAAGDCSVEKAAKNGGIVQINTVDRTVANVLGIVGVYTTVVRGN